MRVAVYVAAVIGLAALSFAGVEHVGYYLVLGSIAAATPIAGPVRRWWRANRDKRISQLFKKEEADPLWARPQPWELERWREWDEQQRQWEGIVARYYRTEQSSVTLNSSPLPFVRPATASPPLRCDVCDGVLLRDWGRDDTGRQVHLACLRRSSCSHSYRDEVIGWETGIPIRITCLDCGKDLLAEIRDPVESLRPFYPRP